MAKRERKNPRDDVSQRKNPLIGPGGKVDPAQVRRQALRQQAAAPAPAPAEPDADAPDSGDDDVLVAAPLAKQKIVFELQKDLDKRLDKYLVDRITFMSRAKLQELIDAGGVSVNGRLAKASTNLRIGDVVEVLIDPPETEEVPPEQIPLDVLFEDEHMIVINKSPDIIVHPARSHLKGTMLNALAWHFQNVSRTGGHLSQVGREFARPGVVHRLDRQTSGVIVFAKSDEAHWKLASQFEHRQTDKRYVAFVHGKVEPPVDVIDVPIGPHPSRERGHREKQVVRHDHLGKPAVTIFRVLGHYTLAPVASPGPLAGSRPEMTAGWKIPKAGAPGAAPATASVVPAASSGRLALATTADSPWASLVEIELKTGRTHQIRVHMQHRLHPLLADDMYDGRMLPDVPAGAGIGRVALHAAMLSIRHPISNKPLQFIAPLPPDLSALLQRLRASSMTTEFTPPGRVWTMPPR
jgi:23S rRNA pseudouridine1911/1915/1917 synthase